MARVSTPGPFGEVQVGGDKEKVLLAGLAAETTPEKLGAVLKSRPTVHHLLRKEERTIIGLKLRHGGGIRWQRSKLAVGEKAVGCEGLWMRTVGRDTPNRRKSSGVLLI